MEHDIVPELLEKINNAVDRKLLGSQKMKKLATLFHEGKADYRDLDVFAVELGEFLRDSFAEHLTSGVLPDDTMYYNIAKRLLNDTLSKNYRIITHAAREVQEGLNKATGLSIKAVTPLINQDRIDNLVEVVSGKSLEVASKSLGEPVINFGQGVVTDVVRANFDKHHQVGLSPKLERIQIGNCCEWCQALVGTYDYEQTKKNKDVYRRHQHCRCLVLYDPKNGKYQNVHTKKWYDIKKNDKINKDKSTAKPRIIKKENIKTDNFSRGSGKNYPIKFIGADHVKFASDEVEKATVIAGKGVKTPIRETPRLELLFKEAKSRWQKMSGETFILYKGEKIRVEIHWYEANGKRCLIKVKRVIDHEN